MYLKKYNLKNKFALVTGAGKGLGKACAIALAEAGANVIIISRTDKDLRAVSKIIKKNNNNIGYIKNYIKVLKMAKGEFAWVIGDDEILKPNSLKILSNSLEILSKIPFAKSLFPPKASIILIYSFIIVNFLNFFKNNNS